MNTGIPTGENLSLVLKEHLGAFKTFAPFILWRSCVKLLENNLPVETMMKKVMKYPDSISRAYNAPFPDSSYKAKISEYVG